MSSLQNSDRHFEQLHAAWLAAQHGGSQLNALNFGGGLGGLDGARNGPRLGEFDLFNRSSIAMPFPGQTASSAISTDYIMRVAAQVDHDTLVRSGNEAFAKVVSEHNGTKEELASLKRAFELMVQTRTDSSIPSGTDGEDLSATDLAATVRRPSGIPRRRAYRREEVPHIRFWTRKLYEESKGRASAQVIRNSKDSQLAFMEHEDGTAISEAEAAKMRETARGVFAQLLRDGDAPAKWGQVSVVSQDFFFNVLSERYPHTAMCEDMWKLQLLATLTYPSWYRINKDRIVSREHDKQEPLTEKQQQEYIWIQQQLEHGRQLKEETMEFVNEANTNLKRNRTKTDTIEARPNKKVKDVMPSSISGPILAPQFPPERYPIHYQTKNGTTVKYRFVPKSTAIQALPASTNVNVPMRTDAQTEDHRLPSTSPSTTESQSRSNALSFDTQIEDHRLRLTSPSTAESQIEDLRIPSNSPSTTESQSRSNALSFDTRIEDHRLRFTSPCTAESQIEDLRIPSNSPSTTESQSRSNALSFDTQIEDHRMPFASDKITEAILSQPSPSTTESQGFNDALTLGADTRFTSQRNTFTQSSVGESQALDDALSFGADTHFATPGGLPSQSLNNESQCVADTLFGTKENLYVPPFTQKPRGCMDALFEGSDVHFEPQECNRTSIASYPSDAGTKVGPHEDLLTQSFTEDSQDFTDTFGAQSVARECNADAPHSERTTPSSANSSNIDAELLLSIGYVDRPVRHRPTPRDHPAPTEGPDALFDMNKQRSRVAVRNPLENLMQARLPSTNVTSTLEPTYRKESPEPDENKENSGKTKGPGRPSKKDADPDREIKPTGASCTPRNLFALEYKEKHHTYPTDRMFRELDAAEVRRFEDLGRKKRASQKAAKTNVKAASP